MQTDVAEKIFERVKGLPPEKQNEVLRHIDEIEGRKNIWDKLDDLTKDVPDEEFASLPADAAENLDHYLYGALKK